MQAETVELLERKGQFPSEQALAVAEAIDMAIADQQLVTVPILDARFAASEAKFDARFAASEAKVDARFAAFDAKMDARFVASEAKMDARFAQSDARIAALEARFEARLDRFRLQIIIAILVGHVALGPVGIAIVEAIVKGMGRAL
jgi:hypothetical protein